MNRIRIILAALPVLLRDVLVASLAGELDLEIVGIADRQDAIDSIIRRTEPHVIVLAESTKHDIDTSIARELRSAAMTVIVIAISAQGDRARIITQKKEKPVEIFDLSTGSLIHAIRNYAAVNGSTKFPPTALS